MYEVCVGTRTNDTDHETSARSGALKENFMDGTSV